MYFTDIHAACTRDVDSAEARPNLTPCPVPPRPKCPDPSAAAALSTMELLGRSLRAETAAKVWCVVCGVWCVVCSWPLIRISLVVTATSGHLPICRTSLALLPDHHHATVPRSQLRHCAIPRQSSAQRRRIRMTRAWLVPVLGGSVQGCTRATSTLRQEMAVTAVMVVTAVTVVSTMLVVSLWSVQPATAPAAVAKRQKSYFWPWGSAT